MIKHTTLNKSDFDTAIKETETFAGFPKFKKTNLQRVSPLLNGTRKSLNGWSCLKLENN